MNGGVVNGEVLNIKTALGSRPDPAGPALGSRWRPRSGPGVTSARGARALAAAVVPRRRGRLRRRLRSPQPSATAPPPRCAARHRPRREPRYRTVRWASPGAGSPARRLVRPRGRQPRPGRARPQVTAGLMDGHDQETRLPDRRGGPEHLPLRLPEPARRPDRGVRHRHGPGGGQGDLRRPGQGRVQGDLGRSSGSPTWPTARFTLSRTL